MSTVVTAPCAVPVPYSPLAMALREELNGLIDAMERSRFGVGQAREPLSAEEWEELTTGLIVVTIDWGKASLGLAWSGDDDHPRPCPDAATRSLDLAGLKHLAMKEGDPRGWFETQAAHIVAEAQAYLIEFYRDGPTDDIPYYRHVLRFSGVAWLAEGSSPGDIRFAFCEGGTASS